ncbi:MAG TPA: flagellar hook-associated protein FlgK [Devosia sp.]|nr:flagellar hook-associated protein FlgK [Devosia sp.]
MGLSVSLSNALSGMNVTQSGLSVVSRNVANAGTPGFHRQTLAVVESNGGFSSYATLSGIQRAFNQALQTQYTSQVSTTGNASVRAEFLERLETFLGMPGDSNSLDKLYGDFQSSMQALAVSPEDYATRAQAVAQAQSLVEVLNSLTSGVQELRRETESQIGAYVDDANRILSSLADINAQLYDASSGDEIRAALLDERDRLASSLAEIIDVRTDYRDDGTVSVMTNTGLGLLDVGVSTFRFERAGNLSANSLFDIDEGENGVGVLTLSTSSGFTLDLVEQGILRSGALGALVELRDTTLTQFQGQIDEIAANLATSFSTIQTEGTAVSVGAAAGFEVDLADMQAGNSFLLNYTEAGEEKQVRVVRVDDVGVLPLDYDDANGVRVVGIDFSGGMGDVATDLSAVLGAGLTITNPSGDVLRIVDDGALGTTDVASMTASTTVTASQGAGLALNLFVDGGNAPFTNSLDGGPQRRGFAGRIAINSEILADNTLLVQHTSGGSLGDSSRVDYFLDRLENGQFTSDSSVLPELGGYRFSGNVQDFVSQMLNFQGNSISRAQSDLQTQQLTMDTLDLRVEQEYGVNIDEEMARLMELQNAYAANARVVSIVQELLQTLMQI